jgi:hypothetical protein
MLLYFIKRPLCLLFLFAQQSAPAPITTVIKVNGSVISSHRYRAIHENDGVLLVAVELPFEVLFGESLPPLILILHHISAKKRL